MTKKLVIPRGHEDSVFVLHLSGGKDSTATGLALKESGIPFRAAFADTAWEAPETYEQLDVLERALGVPVERVGVPGGMVAVARRKAGFAHRTGRWCSQILKRDELAEVHARLQAEHDTDTIAVVGIRAEESADRAALAAFERDEVASYIWRPIMDWTIEDVLAIHHRHNVPVNPLYRMGFERVGCMPCIMSTKEDIRLMAQHFPERVAEIRALEAEFSAERVRRNATGEGEFKHTTATFFMSRATDNRPTGIDEVIAWSRTTRGGRQLPLIQPPSSTGCARWGYCDPPVVESKELTVVDDAEALATMNGFDSAEDLFRCTSSARIDTPDRLAAFKAWQTTDGTKAGLARLNADESEEP